MTDRIHTDPSATRPKVIRSGISLDELGEDLDVRIRLAPDGRVYFHDIPLAMLGVAEALAPGDPLLAERRRLAMQYRSAHP